MSRTQQLGKDVHNESMLQLALPWIAHFGAEFTDESIGEWKATWGSALKHLLQLSVQVQRRNARLAC